MEELVANRWCDQANVECDFAIRMHPLGLQILDEGTVYVRSRGYGGIAYRACPAKFGGSEESGAHSGTQHPLEYTSTEHEYRRTCYKHTSHNEYQLI